MLNYDIIRNKNIITTKGVTFMQRVGSAPDRGDIVQYIIKNRIVPQIDILRCFNSNNKCSPEELIFETDLAADRFNKSKKSSVKYIKRIEGVYTYFEFCNFRSIPNIDEEILDSSGLYCIRLKENSMLPDRYQNILDSREVNYIYIGKATNTLRERLMEELEHIRPGTFFRSIGCVLGYRPIEGHLRGMANQNNYRFNDEDTDRITEWLINNVEVSIIKHDGDFSIETELIRRYCPLLNIRHNPERLNELEEDRRECIRIARGEFNN